MSTCPFTGRSAEWRQLQIAWKQALEGERRAVFISGEPGIGKTRLASEFAKEVERTGGVTLFGRCDEDPLLCYEPFARALQQLATRLSRATAASENGRAMLTELVPALSDPVPDGGSARKEAAMQRLLLFEGVRSVLRTAGNLGPPLLVLDDLQWADADSIRLLRYLLRESWDTPALVLGLFRDTEPDLACEPLRAVIADLSSGGNIEHVELRALEEGDVHAIVLHHLGDSVNADKARAIQVASGGNPFFVNEMATSTDEITRGPGSLPFPVAARDVIARRLSKLSPGGRTLLRRASVLGSSAQLALLRVLADGDEMALASGLGDAVHAGLLYEVGTEYLFSHGLVQRALLQEIPLAERQLLHLRVARAIAAGKSQTADERPFALAAHYRNAGGAAPPSETLPYALEAADAALMTYALHEATDWWEWALELMEALGHDPATRAGLLERMASVVDTGREQSRATRYLERALLLRQETGNPLEIATAQSRLGAAHANGNLRNTDLTRARRYLQAATPCLSEADVARRVAMHISWARLGISSFRPDDLGHAEHAVELSSKLGQDSLILGSRVGLGALMFHTGDITGAMQLLDDVRQATRASGEVVLAGASAFIAAIMAQRFCDPRLAVERLRPELDDWPAPAAAAPWGIAPRLISALADTGDMAAIRALDRQHTAREEERIEVLVEQSAIAFYEGDWSGPVWMDVEASAAGAARRDDRCSRQNLGHWLLRAFRARGEPGRAVAFAHEELASAVAGGSVAQELVARAEFALLCAEASAAEDARAHVSRCREIFARAADRRGLEGKLLLVDALVENAAHGPDGASIAFEQAVEVFHRFSTPWLETRALEDWAEVLLHARRRRDAASKLRQAEVVYRDIGAGEPWLARLAAMGGMAGSNPDALDLPDGMTSREVEVLRLVARGQSNKQIADELVLSVRTVERHIANIYEKAAVHTKSQATAYAYRHHLV